MNLIKQKTGKQVDYHEEKNIQCRVQGKNCIGVAAGRKRADRHCQ
jgi:hypothetical protein